METLKQIHAHILKMMDEAEERDDEPGFNAGVRWGEIKTLAYLDGYMKQTIKMENFRKERN